jgi:hypothetical protein
MIPPRAILAAVTLSETSRVELADRLAEAGGDGPDRAPVLVLGRDAPISKNAWPGALVNRVLPGGTVPILLYVAEQIAQL